MKRKRIEELCRSCCCYIDNWDNEVKETCKFSDSECSQELDIFSKENCNCYVDIYIAEDGEAEILSLNKKSNKLSMVDEDVRVWGRLKDLQTLTDYSNEGKLLKYMPYMVLIGTMIALGVTIYITYMGFSQFMPQITGLMTKATEVLESSAMVIEKLNTTPTGPPV